MNRITAPDKTLSDLQIFEQTAVDALRRLRRHIESETAGEGPATGFAPLAEILETLQVEKWIDDGGMNRASFDLFLQKYLEHSVQLHHPHYIAHQVSVPDYPGALGAIVNGVMNNPMAIFEMGPAAATLEFAVINWMLRKVGWSPQPLPGSAPSQHAGGVLTHGGSLANLTALLAARARVAPEAWDNGAPSNLAVLTPDVSHYSVARAVSILGLGANAIYHVETTRHGVIRPDRLETALKRVCDDGRIPMALNANACSTATGLHDPLRAIGEFCNENGIWFHADACHGATALLSPPLRKYLDGIELADSVVWDAHKMMQVPVLCAALLLKDAKDFDRAFQQDAHYLAYGDSDTYDSLPRAIECTKASLSLKVFLNLAWRGEAALGEFVRDRYEATRRFHEIIRSRDGFECPYEPETNILCFRYGTDDVLQVRIRDAMVRDKRFHITSAMVDGKRYMRLTVMNRLTDEKTIAALLDAIESYAREFSR